jgi:hypothetical protein
MANKKVESIATVLLGRGLHSLEAKTYLAKWLAADPTLGLHAFARAVKVQELAKRTLPPDAGILTHALVHMVEESALRISDAIFMEGTPLSRLFKASDLADAIVASWVQGFAPEIPNTAKLATYSEEEYNARQTVAVQAVARVLLSRYVKDGAIQITEETFETLCAHVTRIALAAFDEPNKFNHAHLHGDAKEDRTDPLVG